MDAAQIAALVGARHGAGVLPRDRFCPSSDWRFWASAPPASRASWLGTTTSSSCSWSVRASSRRRRDGRRRPRSSSFLRYPAIVPSRSSPSPFRLPVELGEEEAFLLLPLYLVLAASALALAYRMLRGDRPTPPPFLLALPLRRARRVLRDVIPVDLDERRGDRAFFVFPFTAGFAVVARAPLAAWLPRALVVTLVSLGALFAAIGIWQAQTRTLFFARDVAVANAYTTFVTSPLQGPSLYGRYLIVPIVVLLVVILLRRGRTVEWVAAAAAAAFLFWGSSTRTHSRASSLRGHVRGRRRRDRTTPADRARRLRARRHAGGCCGGCRRRERAFRQGRDERPLAARQRDSRCLRGPGRSAASGWVASLARARRSRARAHPAGTRPTTPLTVLAELGALGFALRLGARGGRLGAVDPHQARSSLRSRARRRPSRARRPLASLRGVLRRSPDVGRSRPRRSRTRRWAGAPRLLAH